MKKYSIAEMDRMRQCIKASYLSGVPYYAADRSAEIENRLCAYMQNGTTLAELEEMAAAGLKREIANQEAIAELRKRERE